MLTSAALFDELDGDDTDGDSSALLISVCESPLTCDCGAAIVRTGVAAGWSMIF